MAFPTSPTNGQTVVVNNTSYTYNSYNGTWSASVAGTTSPIVLNNTSSLVIGNIVTTSGIFYPNGATAGGSGTSFYTQNTAPVSAPLGSTWYQGNADIVYEYVKDAANNSIWIDISSKTSSYNNFYVSNSLVVGNTLTFNSAVTSTSTSTGALILPGSGGLGVGGNIYAGGNLSVASTANVGNVSTTNGVYYANGAAYGITSLTSGAGITITASGSVDTIAGTGTTINSQTSAYSLVASDAGKTISITTGGVTVPNATIASGSIITIYNNSGSSQTITQGSGLTLQWAGQSSSTTGNRTLGLYGICSILFVTTSNAVISGAGLT